VLGFANAYGAPFVVLWTLFLAPVWLAAQPSAQIALALATAALLAHLELVDAVRDARALSASFASDPAGALARLQQQGLASSTTGVTTTTTQAQGVSVVTLDEVVPLALLAQLALFATGHQAVIASVQWKSAFVLTSTASYLLSPPLVVLNSFGPTALLALAAPLLGIWNVAPLGVGVLDATPSSTQGQQQHQQQGQRQGRRPTQQQVSDDAQGAAAPKSHAPVAVLAAVRAALGISLYFGGLLLGSALSAAWLRRHLMVWKVFAPRYMVGAMELLFVDLALLVGIGLGVGRVVSRISRLFSVPVPGASASASAAS